MEAGWLIHITWSLSHLLRFEVRYLSKFPLKLWLRIEFQDFLMHPPFCLSHISAETTIFSLKQRFAETHSFFHRCLIIKVYHWIILCKNIKKQFFLSSLSHTYFVNFQISQWKVKREKYIVTDHKKFNSIVLKSGSDYFSFSVRKIRQD